MDAPVAIRSAASAAGQRPFETLDPASPNRPSHGYGTGDHGINFLHHWQVLTKRKWAVLATFTVVWVLAILATMRQTRLYEAVSELAIFPENSNVLGLRDGESSGSGEDWDYNVALETQTAILRSDALALKVIDTMHLDKDPRFVGKAAAQDSESQDSPELKPSDDETTAVLSAFHGGLSVQTIPRTRLVELRYLHNDPSLARDIVNSLAKTYIEENFRKRYEATTQTSDWLSTQLADLQLKVESSDEKLVRYQKAHSILGIDEKQNIVTAKLDELNKELTEAETERMQKEANYKLSMASDPTTFAKAPPAGTSTLLDKLREKEADLNNQHAQATTQFGPAFPKVMELRNQLQDVRSAIGSEQTRIQHSIRDEYLAALQREELLRSAFEQQKQQANQLNESAIEYSVLKRDAESNRQLYQSLLERMKEAGVAVGLKSSNIRIVDVARTPTVPVKPNVPRNIKLGFLLGLCLAVGIAFVLESLDNTVTNLDEVSELSSLPALGIIPLQFSTNGNSRKRHQTGQADEGAEAPILITCARPKSQVAESYRALRTSILLSSFGAPPKVILVTSALPQEGKTTISANSAVVLAQRGSSVLLIDADLRRPGVEKIFGITASSGLSTIISGVDKPEDAILPCTQVKNLYILPAGPIPPQPSELLGSNAMKEYIQQWRSEFDHVIIDTPPCLSVTDAVVLSPEADRIIVVARSGRTTRVALRRACGLLLQVNAKVMGIVLNAFNLRSANGYYYSYGGRYARRYYDDSSLEGGDAPVSKVS